MEFELHTCKLLSVLSGVGGHLALCPVFNQWQGIICRSQVLSHGSSTVGSLLYSKPASVVCTERGASFGSGVPKYHTFFTDTVKFWTFHSLKGRIFSKAWHLAATGTFSTNFLRSKALGKAAVLGLPCGPSSLDHHKNDDSCLHNILV